MTIGERLREERVRLGFSQTDFAALGGKTKKTQIEWEAGKASPNASFLEAAAKAGTDVLYVLTGIRQVAAAVMWVGYHSQPYSRLIEKVSDLAAAGKLNDEDVVALTSLATQIAVADAVPQAPLIPEAVNVVPPSRPSAREFGPRPDRGSQPRILGEESAEPATSKTRKGK